MTGVTSYGFTVDELFAPQMRCSYPSKVCLNPRAVKLCGSLHKLCEFHRKKANLNQKRLQQRRRVMRAQTMAAAQSQDPEQQQDCGDARQSAASSYDYSASSPTAVDASSLSLLLSLDEGGDKCEQQQHHHYGYAFQYDELSVQDAQLLQSILFGEPNFSAFGFSSAGVNSGSNGSNAVGDDMKVLHALAQSFDGAVEMLDYELCL
ncbi:hypothetical protein Gpo141_00007682 [Globisporangium polare]